MVLATYFDMGSSTCHRLLSHSSSPGLQHIIMESYKEDDARAGTVEIEDITRCKGNRQILRRLQGDDVTFSRVVVSRGHGYNDDYHVVDHHPNSTASDGCYVPRATDDLGWLGYYVGQSSRLKELSVWRDGVTNVQLTAFCRNPVSGPGEPRGVPGGGAPDAHAVLRTQPQSDKRDNVERLRRGS